MKIIKLSLCNTINKNINEEFRECLITNNSLGMIVLAGIKIKEYQELINGFKSALMINQNIKTHDILYTILESRGIDVIRSSDNQR